MFSHPCCDGEEHVTELAGVPRLSRVGVHRRPTPLKRGTPTVSDHGYLGPGKLSKVSERQPASKGSPGRCRKTRGATRPTMDLEGGEWSGSVSLWRSQGSGV